VSGLTTEQAKVPGTPAAARRTAKLPDHLTPHCLRHTFAVELVRRGTPLPYVQAQLGHASISMTVDTYGRWLPTGSRTLIDQLDGDQVPETAERAVAAASGCKSATNPESAQTPAQEVIESTGPIPPPPPFYVLNNLFAPA
jgi:integrase